MGVGKEQEGQQLLTHYQSRISTLADQCRTRGSLPSVACIEWMEPLMAAGNWVPELIQIAGGRPFFGKAGEQAPWITWEALAEADPDIVVLMPCEFSIDRIEEEMSVLTHNPVWTKLKAVQTGKVYVTDGNQFFNRPGPRLIESLEILAEIFSPSQISFGHEGTDWRRWTPIC